MYLMYLIIIIVIIMYANNYLIPNGELLGIKLVGCPAPTHWGHPKGAFVDSFSWAPYHRILSHGGAVGRCFFGDSVVFLKQKSNFQIMFKVI